MTQPAIPLPNRGAVQVAGDRVHFLTSPKAPHALFGDIWIIRPVPVGAGARNRRRGRFRFGRGALSHFAGAIVRIAVELTTPMATKRNSAGMPR
jgi:hypothetical protein